VPSPESDGVVFTGRLSVQAQPWLADHVVLGQVVVPGTALVEMVLRAGEEVGCGVVEELTLLAPLVVGVRGVRVQVVVDGRVVGVFSDGGEGWVKHVEAVLGVEGGEPGFDLMQWPPVGAEVVDVAGFYEGLAEAGLVYGPAFQGVGALWRRGEEVFAEVSGALSGEGDGYGLHPAVFDAALHAVALTGVAQGAAMPFAWSGVR
ncbi:polyketide synthase dehydratase domain-containing protein, partial [Streptosporangium sp. DT93]|uniref:polyketide synthase dehydratase domain-containing protein n=1 Tax=Streptosporangium sp. DT93 TaxID=3393428 RepID=UPI003CEAAF55